MAKGNVNPLKGMAGKLSKALTKHKDEESTVEDFGSLPAGIEGGIAELYEAKIGEYANGKLKGKPYFSMRATVLSPVTFVDVHGVKRKIKGLQTKVGPEPMCDTPDNKGDKARKTLDDHVEWVLKQLRTVGVDTSEIEDDDDLMNALEELKETAPQITFRTWQGKASKQFPNPRVNETWTGVYEADEDDEDTDDDDEEDDRTAKSKKKKKKDEEEEEEEDEDTDDVEENDEDEEDADEEEDEPKAKKGGKGKKKGSKDVDEDEEDDGDDDESDDSEDEEDDDEDEEVFDDGAVNLDELAEEADGGDKDAKRKLLDLAADKNIRKVKGMTFEDLVAKLKGEEGEETEDEDEDDEEEDNDWEPQEDEVYAYLPEGKDPKTKKPYKKPIQVIVKKVNKKGKTVDLMDNKTKAKFPKVKWLDLQQVD